MASAAEQVLVTGAAGFLGAHLCRRLAATGAVVHGVSQQPRQAGAGDGVTRWWQADLRDPAQAQAVVAAARPGLVYHLASRVTGARDPAVVRPTLEDTLLTTVSVLAAAEATGRPRVVLAGSMEEPPAGHLDTPSSPYAAAKVAAAAYGRLYAGLYAMSVVQLRIHMVYGPGQRDVTKLVPATIRALLRGEPPQVSSGRRRVDWVYVEDVVSSLVCAGTVPVAGHAEFEVGTGVRTSVRDVVETLVRLTGARVRPRYGVLADRPLEGEPVANPDGTVPGCDQWLPLEEGLRRTVDWYAKTARSGEDGVPS